MKENSRNLKQLLQDMPNFFAQHNKRRENITTQDQIILEIERLARQGNIKAQLVLAGSYLLGTNGVNKDYSKGIYWLHKAGEQGDATAQAALGAIYYRGQYVSKDYLQAAYWSKKAAEQGNKNAQTRIGFMYYEGNGVAKDYFQAAYWLQKAAQQGIPEAQFALGSMYAGGKGIAPDPEQALYWLKKSADQGFEPAQKTLKDLINSMDNKNESKVF